LGEPSNEQISAKEQKSASFLISNLAATHLKMVNFLLVSAKLICSMKNICAIEAARFSVFFFLFSLSPECKILPPKHQQQQGVCHTVALPFTLKTYLKTKRRIMETQIFDHAKI
jgi:hypothetical protein